MKHDIDVLGCGVIYIDKERVCGSNGLYTEVYDRPAKKWIKHSGDEWVVRVECPNCHRRFQFSPRLMWKCCPLCETKMNGMVKRKRIDDDNN